MKKLLNLALTILMCLASVALGEPTPEKTLPPAPPSRSATDPEFDYFALMADPEAHAEEYYWIVGKVIYADESDAGDGSGKRRLIAYVAIDGEANKLAVMWHDRPSGYPMVYYGDSIGFHGYYTGLGPIHSDLLGDMDVPYFMVLDNIYTVEPEE